MGETKVLNLYAGIGGNRKLWDNVDVTAIEYDPEIAAVYQDNFPNDEVIVTDAHEFLEDNYSSGWDFIWASPPCPTHSQLQAINNVQHGGRYPDMSLYQEIILLDFFCGREGFDYVVENVQSYYEPLIEPQQRARHFFWSNFHIPQIEISFTGVLTGASNNAKFDYESHEAEMGYDLSEYEMSKSKKGKMLRNCVHPKLGESILRAARSERQATVDAFTGN